MSKEKQIDEMAKLICNFPQCINYNSIGECKPTECQIADKAEALYNAGYRKIPTTDWLTKGVPQEQLEREADEAIKEIFERNCEKYGYRKQSEGEWKLEHETYGKMRCSVCGKECPTERKPDPYEDYQMTDFYITSPFCPNCGAKMKGGAE